MTDLSFTNLLLIAGIAVAAPLIVGYVPALRVPAVVLEIVAGIVVGPSVLGLVEVDVPVQVLALVGMALLLFLAGLEIDVHRLRGSLLRSAVLGYGITIGLGVAAGLLLHAAGWVASPLLLAITLSATSLGLVVAVLKDADQIGSEVGQTTLAAASVADFSAIVLLSLFFSTSGGSTGRTLTLLSAFAAFVVATFVVASQVGRSMRLGDVLVRLQDTTAEIRVRLAVLLLVGLVFLADRFGLETILGAFLAGAVIGLLDRDAASHPRFRVKLEAIGYGFLIPVFFVASGVRLDLRGLFAEPSTFLRVPVLVLVLFLLRGLPAFLHVRRIGRRAAAAAGLLQATSLPFIVTAAQIGMALRLFSPVTGAALVCAGLLSVVAFPPAALALLRGGTRAQNSAVPNREAKAAVAR
jgi:Kef-type K+ transport system membrane component KefB